MRPGRARADGEARARQGGAAPLAAVGVMLLAGALSIGASSAAELQVADERPTRGETVQVALLGVSDPSLYKLEVIYRPSSQTARTDTLGRFRPDGTLLWTPRKAGLCTLGASTLADSAVATRNVAVRFDSVPFFGILIFLGAGVLLFGGTTIMLRRTLEK